jgi:hypothetical protein
MATTYSTAKVALDEIAQRIQSNRQRLQQAKALAATAEGDLAAMPAQYGGVIADINAINAGNNAALQTLKAEKDQLVAEFTALQATATSMKTATAAVEV